jgi:hypothetical protein
MACCEKIYSIAFANCRLLLINTAGYTFMTFDLTELMLDAGNMPESFVMRDLVSSFTISTTTVDANLVPTTYATFDLLLVAIQNQIDACYCPCVRGE